MASAGIELQNALVEISANTELAMTAGVKYTLQNKSDYRLWLLEHEGGGVPRIDSASTIRRRIFVEGWGDAIVSFAAGNSLYAWYHEGQDGVIAMVEV